MCRAHFLPTEAVAAADRLKALEVVKQPRGRPKKGEKLSPFGAGKTRTKVAKAVGIRPGSAPRKVWANCSDFSCLVDLFAEPRPSAPPCG